MGVHAFPKGICSKVNVIASLEFEIVYPDIIVQYVFQAQSNGAVKYTECISAEG